MTIYIYVGSVTSMDDYIYMLALQSLGMTIYIYVGSVTSRDDYIYMLALQSLGMTIYICWLCNL